MSGEDAATAAREVIAACIEHGWTIATAESCTGGLVAAALTDVPGASAAFECGYVTYSNDAKVRTLGVSADLVARHGAVSKEVARAMAEGALREAGADLAVAITGIAGPGGGSAKKPVGLVHIAAASRARTLARMLRVRDDEPDADRERVRQISAAAALLLALESLGGP